MKLLAALPLASLATGQDSKVSWYKKWKTCEKNAISEYYHADVDPNSYNLDCQGDEANMECTITCPVGDMIHEGTSIKAKFGTFTCAEKSAGKYMWSYGAKVGGRYFFKECKVDACPKKGVKSWGARKFFVQESDEASYELGYFKIPRKDVEKKFDQQNLQDNGWTLVFDLKEPLIGKVNSANGAWLSINKAGTRISVTSKPRLRMC